MRDTVWTTVSGSISIKLLALSLAVPTLDPAAAAPMPPATAVQAPASSSAPIEVRAVARGGRAVVGPRGAAYRGRTAVVGPRGNVAVRRTTVVRPGYHGGGVRWARPGWYRWPAGGAIAAGAAIGVVTAATAAAWAGAAPAPGMCWYYADPSRTQGFWDYCQ